jgi:hypothetical protein
MIPAVKRRDTTNNRLQYYDLPCFREFGVNAKRTFDHQCDSKCRLDVTSTGEYCCVKVTKKRVRDAHLQNRIPEAKRQKYEDTDDMQDSSFGNFVKKYCKHRKCSKEYAAKKYFKATN